MKAVAIANSLKPDLFVLVGDFAYHGSHIREELSRSLEALSARHTSIGVRTRARQIRVRPQLFRNSRIVNESDFPQESEDEVVLFVEQEHR